MDKTERTYLSGNGVASMLADEAMSHPEVRAAFRLWLRDRTPWNRHQLETALSGSGMSSRLDRERVIRFLKTSRKHAGAR